MKWSSVIKWSKVDDIVCDDPAEQKGEEAIHKVLFQHIFCLYCIFLCPQVPEYVQVAR